MDNQNTEQEQIQNTTEENIQPNVKNRKILLFTILGVVLLIIIFILGYFFLYSKKDATISITQPTNQINTSNKVIEKNELEYTNPQTLEIMSEHDQPEHEKDLSEDYEIKSDCSGWYAINKYRAGNTLTKLTEIEDISNNENYTTYNDEQITFYYPNDWSVEYDKIQNQYKINYTEHVYFFITIGATSNYITDYNECLGRCFEEDEPTSPYSWKAFNCSESFSPDNLDKVLSGDYISYLSTGSLPPGGAGSFSFERIFDDKTVTGLYSSEDFQFYPSAHEDDETRIAEMNNYKQEFYKLMKSIKLK